MNYICRVMHPTFANDVVDYVESEVATCTTEQDQIARRIEIMTNLIAVWNELPDADYNVIPEKFRVREYTEERLLLLGVEPETQDIVLDYRGTPIIPNQTMIIISYTPEDEFVQSMNEESVEAILSADDIDVFNESDSKPIVYDSKEHTYDPEDEDLPFDADGNRIHYPN